jgi:hypothetical protein
MTGDDAPHTWRMIRQSVCGLAKDHAHSDILEGDRTQKQNPLLLIAL